MKNPAQWVKWLQGINTENYEQKALQLFNYQFDLNPVYRDYCRALHINQSQVDSITKIPFLPISFFKTHCVFNTGLDPTLCFESSGTTGSINSKHFVSHPDYYHYSFVDTFHKFYGDPHNWIIIGLLPSYLERSNSSLVYMVKELISLSGKQESGFYLDDLEILAKVLKDKKYSDKVWLIGVTFALLDFAEQYPINLNNVVVMETGGMKGRKTEMTRPEVHQILKQHLGLSQVHSEFGMTELFSQAYAAQEGIFRPGKCLKAFVRDESDPLSSFCEGTGALNFIDLANIDSCAFIATEDLGRLQKDGSFEVLGRMDEAMLRGCSLLSL